MESSPIFGVNNSKMYFRELPPLSPWVPPTYPESARLLKDVNKSSLATPGEACMIWMAFELSKKTTFSWDDLPTSPPPVELQPFYLRIYMVATTSGNSFIASFLDIWMNFIPLHQPPHGWVPFPHPKAGRAPKRIKTTNWSFDVFWIHVSSSFQGSVTFSGFQFRSFCVSWHIACRPSTRPKRWDSDPPQGIRKVATWRKDGGYDGNGQIYGFLTIDFPQKRPKMKTPSFWGWLLVTYGGVVG